MNFWSLPGCLKNVLKVQKKLVHLRKYRVKPPKKDQQVWGDRSIGRQGKFVKEASCLLTIHGNRILFHDFWLAAGRAGPGGGAGLREVDTPSSLPSLVSLTSLSSDTDDSAPFLPWHHFALY